MRCTISQHQVTIGEGHLDVFFESENVLLETYEASLELMPGFLKGEEIVCHKKKDHRTLYLDFEGELSQNRGFIKIVWKGALRVLHAALQNKNPGIAFWQCDATKMNASKTRAVAACYRYQTNSGAVA